MKNFIKWTLVAILIIVGLVVFFNVVKTAYKKNKNDNLETEMLQVQAKIEIELEKYHVNNENGLKGEKIDDMSELEEYDAENTIGYFRWNKATLNEVGISQSVLNDDEYYIINYDLNEVIYPGGVKTQDGDIYYKLTEIEESKKTHKAEEETTENNTQKEGEKTDEGDGNNQAE